ncbi:tail fiber protein [Photorhabdus thracensis]|uniref:tail fiber protein n=1 Tax=Photorhabdus thracensis TaxID=230089 RepID=UPI001E4DF89D|nr:tail fiber protein [Photorhabdus thracensis]MCC8422942.1 hypothetical protein [Photorhabdus thracensis]
MAQGAYPKSGGVVNGDVNVPRLFAQYIVGIGGDRHGMQAGGMDAASFNGNNLEILSWYGIGLKSTQDSKTRIYFNLRTGDIATKGTVNASSARVGKLSVNNASDFPNIEFEAANKHLIGIEGTSGNRLTIYANNENGNRKYNLATPEKGGTLATLDDITVNAVPNSRKVNGKALTGDISLNAGDVGAFKLGLTGTYSVNNQVPWNADTGLYDLQRPGDSQLVAHFYNGVGSCPAFQLRIAYRNGGIAYRSARDSYGFEEDWTDIYTTRNKPSAEDIGAYTKTECDSRYPLKSGVGVINLRFGSWATEGGWTDETKDWSAPAGHVLVGLGTIMWSSGRQHLANVHYRPIQAYINGIWVTISAT